MTNNAVRTPADGDVLDPAIARRNRVAIVLLLAAVFVVFLNETTMSVAVPEIMDDLRITPSHGQWLTTSFALTMAVVIPTTGYLLQRFQTRPIFITAMSLFTVGTLIAATSPGFSILIVGRVVQASGTAIMMPLLMTTVLNLVAMSRSRPHHGAHLHRDVGRPRYRPAMSGLILPLVPWRGLFWVMLPIAAAMLVIGIRVFPTCPSPRKVPLDVLSVIVSALAFSGLVYGLSTLGQAAEGTALLPSWIPLVVGGVSLVLFVCGSSGCSARIARSSTCVRSAPAPSRSRSACSCPDGVLFGIVIVYRSTSSGRTQSTVIIGLTLLPGGLLMGLHRPARRPTVRPYGPASARDAGVDRS